jgi:hypothetical protein|tara:strand:+ start:3182 stop:3565 length:384 start_codon:yes stop_codon:yes gene_type:complete
MKLIIIKENFDLKRIVFRDSKKSIKISYDINHVSMIGITINLMYDYLIDRGTYLIIKVHPDDVKLFSDIDNHFKKTVKKYDNIMYNGSIKVKKHNEYTTPKDNKLPITINSIKMNTSHRNKVQIFSI